MGVDEPPERSADEIRQWDRVAVIVGVAVLAWLFYRQLMAGSLVVDGTRYFVLDDDMMISMRYGRNLAEGHGLVWNPGEHVEGYTNLLWTLVMAVVHLLPIGDAHTAVAMKVISFVLLAISLQLSLRLLRIFVPRSLVAAPLLVLAFVTCVDIVNWAAWGFETSLLGLLELVFLVCLLEQRRMPLGWIALALIPLVRSDALHLFVANALLALLLTRAPRQTVIRVAICLVPFAAHLVLRHAYYGDWLPNTYYLRIHLLDDRFGRGWSYVWDFLLQYAVVLTAAAAAAISMLRTDRRGLTLFVVTGAALAYALTAGGDMLSNFRLVAPVMPVVFVFAVVGVMKAGAARLGLSIVAAVFLVTPVAPGRPLSALVAPSTNGDPPQQLQVAMLVNKNAQPDSRIAVLASGIVPYFTRMDAVDILGKNDRHIARLRPFPGSLVAHGKIDPDYSLAKDPDLVVSYRSYATVESLPTDRRSTDYVFSFMGSTAFQRRYRPYPILEDFLLRQTAVFTHRDSRENETRRWVPVTVRR